MEVHHHAHTARKKWSHYFWEFLMLFLAVFCGFMAENQREHMIEHNREKQYARTLYEDLQMDTSILQAAISQNIYVTERIDSFRNLVGSGSLNTIPSGTLYYFGRFGTRYFQLALQDATLEQLKNSGGLRYFKKHAVVNSIARYDQARRDLQNALSLQDLVYNELIKSRNVLFDASYMDVIMDFDLSNISIDSFKRQNPPLLSKRYEDFIQYANYCQLRSYNNKSLLRNKQATLDKANSLLVILKKEYHLN